MANLRLFLLGAPYLEVDGQTVEIQRRKVLALLSYLAVTGQIHQRDFLATLLWPEDRQTQARAALGRHLSELRKLIGDKNLRADREAVAVDDLWVDVQQFRQLVTTFDHNIPDAVAVLSQAAALYRADFLTGFSLPDCPDFDEWQFFQSESLRQEYAAALRHLVTALGEKDDSVTALLYARRLLALDTLDEVAQRQVMELYAVTGQQAAALRQYQICVQTLDDELGVLPSAETTKLYERIRAGELAKAAESQASQVALGESRSLTVSHTSLHNLPAQTTPFIGREAELEELGRLLIGTERRLVTIVGPGGMGKTRLSLAFAEDQRATGHFPHGVFYVSLAPLSEVESIVPAIAEAIGYTFAAEAPSHRPAKAQLLSYLRGRQMLLVLDNFEHLLAGSELLSAILRTAPHVRILATSRERLRLYEEQLFPIRGLVFPNAEVPTHAARYTAVELFIQSAQRIHPEFDLTDADLAYVTLICRQVEGMPLGIELAAGWVDLLSPAEIAAEIQRSLDFLATEARNVPNRQHSLRAVFDSSWERLSEVEQAVFARFSVFQGGFTRQAAEVVTGVSLRLLSALVAKSLLQYEKANERYQMHELLRQYAMEKLKTSGQTARVRDAHAAYFASFLQQQEADLKGAGYRQAEAAIGADFENVRRAWLWAVERRDFPTLEQSIEGLYSFLYQDFQRYQVGQALIKSARVALAPVEGEVPHPVWGKLLARVLPYGSGEFEEPAQARVWLDQALTIAEVSQDHAEQAFCRQVLGQVYLNLGDRLSAAAVLEQSLGYYRQVGDRFYMAQVLQMLGKTYRRQHKYHQALESFRQSLSLRRELGISEISVLVLLSLLLSFLQEYEEAEAHLQRAYQVSQTAGRQSDTAGALVYLSEVFRKKGDFERARKAVLEALAIAEENHLEYRQLQARMQLGFWAYERGEYEQALAHLSHVQGRSTTYSNQRRVAFVLGLTMAHLGKDDLTRSYLARRLRGPVALASHNLPVAAFLFKEVGDYVRATQLLALFSTLHVDISGMLGHRIAAEMQSMQDELATALQPEVFAAAWEQGKQLDLTVTLAALAEELSSSGI